MPFAPRPRLVDLARELDLSPSTVSRALGGSRAISATTRRRVQAAARKAGYSVNPAASGLKRGSTLNIGLVAVMNHWYSGAVATGADRVAAANGYDFVVATATAGPDGEIDEERARRLGSRVDGALVVDVRPDSGRLSRLAEALGTPVVTLGCQGPGLSSVVVDNHAIGSLAARHLAGLGHRRCAVLSLEAPNMAAVDNGVRRAEGFAAVMQPDDVVRLSRDDRGARQARILAAVDQPGPSALFCTSDSLAIEVVALLRQAGRSVPGEISVVGVDDQPLAQPIGLTTVAQDPDRMGATAVELLLQAIKGESPRVVESGTVLIARQTTAPRRR